MLPHCHSIIAIQTPLSFFIIVKSRKLVGNLVGASTDKLYMQLHCFRYIVDTTSPMHKASFSNWTLSSVRYQFKISVQHSSSFFQDSYEKRLKMYNMHLINHNFVLTYVTLIFFKLKVCACLCFINYPINLIWL